MRKSTAVLVSTLLALALTQVARADDEGSHKPMVGDVHFKVECNAAAQARFNVAMAYYHSFQWQGAIATADEVLKAKFKGHCAQKSYILYFYPTQSMGLFVSRLPGCVS